MNKKGIIKVLLIIVFIVVITLAISTSVYILSSDERGISHIGKYIPIPVESTSMYPEINKGDLIITKEYNNEELLNGNIVSFISRINDNKLTIRRIKNSIKINNITSYITKADNFIEEDKYQLAPGDIISIYNGTKLKNVGYVLNFLKSTLGFITCIVLPLIVFFIIEVYEFIKIILKFRNDN